MFHMVPRFNDKYFEKKYSQLMRIDLRNQWIILILISILIFIKFYSEVENEIKTETRKKQSPWELGILERRSRGIIIGVERFVYAKLEVRRINKSEAKNLNLTTYIFQDGKSFELELPSYEQIPNKEKQDSIIEFFREEDSELKLFLTEDSHLTLNSSVMNRRWKDTSGVVLNEILSKEEPTEIEITLFDNKEIEDKFFFSINPAGLQKRLNEL